MVNIILLLFCVVAGMLFKKYKLVQQGAHKGINTYILYIALPAVSFKYMPYITWNKDLIFPALSSAVVLIGSFVFATLYCRMKKYSRRTQSTFELSTGYGNTSFLGFPIVAAYLGEQSLKTAIVCDQSMFFLLSIFGIISAIRGNRSSTERVTVRSVAKRLFSFPPFIGCAIAILLNLFIDMRPAVPFFDKLAATVGPPALFSVGIQLNIKGWRQYLSQIVATLSYKLLIAPLLVIVVALLTQQQGEITRVSILEAGMPTLVTASIISEQYNLNSKLINLVISIGIIFGLFTTALWDLLVQYAF